jgi:hydroxypyruvate reductase
MNEVILRNHGSSIIDTTLAAVDPLKLLTDSLIINGDILSIKGQKYNLSEYKKICVIGGGKASGAMARGLENLLKTRIHSGLVVVKDGHGLDTDTIKIREAGHPVPDTRSVSACNELISFICNNRRPDTLFISLLSGGASSLLTAPVSDISLEDKQEVTSLLLHCGAEIHEINTIRKHLSQIKGGRLARLTHPAQVINLVISDVIGDDLKTIGSGPFTGDSTTWADCLNILGKHDLMDSIPKPVFHKLFQGHQGFVKDTPWPQEKCFKNIASYIIGTNILAQQAAANKAALLGYNTYILPDPVAGDTLEAAKKHTELIHDILKGKGPVNTPVCIISGGETTITLPENHGLGGRNQQFSLATAKSLQGLHNIALFSIGTDGTDGPTDAAGALATGSTLKRAAELGLNADLFLEHHDAYNFFNKIGDLLKTGPTLTNVMDIHFILINSPNNQ